MTSLIFPPYVFVNGQLFPQEKASMPVNDLSVLRGYGVFDFFMLKQGKPLFFKEHWNRLQQSASGMNLDVPFVREEVLDMITALYALMPYEMGGVRITLTGGCSPDGYLPGDVSNSIVSLSPFATFPAKLSEKGIGLMTQEYRRPFSKLKTIDYTMGIRMLPEAKRMGLQELLFVNNGWVSECPRSNVFAVTQQDVLITPADGVLEGVTRKRLLKHASTILKTEERPVHLEELLAAKEVWITSTTKGIWKVANIDGQLIGEGNPGKYASKFYEMLLEEMKGGAN